MKHRRLAAAVAGAALTAVTAVGVHAGPVATAAGPPVGLPRLVAEHATGAVVGIATFDAPPDASAVAQLRDLGLQVQAMKHLPLAIVKGSTPT